MHVTAFHNVNLPKSTDYTTVDVLNPLGKDSAWRNEVPSLVDWCHLYNLDLNISKTKELVGDFYSNGRALLSLTINGVKLERVDSFKFLGTMISSTLKWDDNLVCIIKKSHQRLFFLCQLRKLGVFGEGLLQFHRAVIESVHSSLTSLWHGNSAAQQKQQLDRIVCIASKKSSTVTSLAY